MLTSGMDAVRVLTRRAVVLCATVVATTAMLPATPARAAAYKGSVAGLPLVRPIVGMATTPTGLGYWLVASDGGIFTFGDANYYGSTAGMHLRKPIVGMAATPSGRGYWLVASDGGIFTFGNARFRGSTGGINLAKPIVGMERTASGRGYWLVASDGGIFSFGDAKYYGSAAGRYLGEPIVGIARRPGGGGYWLVTRSGAVFAFGRARHFGSATGGMGGHSAVAIVASPARNGYWIASQWGGVNTGTPGGIKLDPKLKRTRGSAAVADELVRRINIERKTRGLPALTIDPYLSFTATAWAHYLAATGQFAHQNVSILLQGSSGRFRQTGENLYGGGGAGAVDAGTAHVTLMRSTIHRETMLLPEQRMVGVGAACMNGMLIVVEDFATPWGVPAKPHGVPPMNPIASSSQGGASC
jgi:uncharacterized protein YkwD